MRRNRKPRHPLAMRPGQPGGYGPGWRLLCRRIQLRDRSTCRHCGWIAADGQVDHLLPRRLFATRRDPDRDRLDNLCWLCPSCHARKTSVIEPALFAADYSTFRRFLDTVGITGPIPDPDFVGRALARLVTLRHATSS